MNQTIVNVSQEKLVSAWQETLPRLLNASDEVKVTSDTSQPASLYIEIVTAGHNQYRFHFRCTYVDGREVNVVCLEAWNAEGRLDPDDLTAIHLTDDYKRHIHECAQQLKPLTEG